MKHQKWIGLAHIRPRIGNTLLGDNRGAFAPVVGLASSPDELATLAATLLSHYQFDVVEFIDIEPLSHRLENYDVESDILSIAEKLSEDNRVQICALEAYRR